RNQELEGGGRDERHVGGKSCRGEHGHYRSMARRPVGDGTDRRRRHNLYPNRRGQQVSDFFGRKPARGKPNWPEWQLDAGDEKDRSVKRREPDRRSRNRGSPHRKR